MTVVLAIEASQPNGKSFRLVMGCILPLTWLATVANLARLF
jgi:hypothetical protein